MQEVTPSEILGELRNDGRSRHHRAELEKEFDRLEAKLAEVKENLETMKPGMVEQGGA
jgi:uncharacterized protein YhaN